MKSINHKSEDFNAIQRILKEDYCADIVGIYEDIIEGLIWIEYSVGGVFFKKNLPLNRFRDLAFHPNVYAFGLFMIDKCYGKIYQHIDLNQSSIRINLN